MANWCSTEYTLYSDNKEELRSLYDLMKGLEEREIPLVENGFGKTWLGCLVTALGEDWNNFSCRGEWECLELNDDDTITFSTECAWYRCFEVDNLIQHKYPSIQIFFKAEESGMSIYEKNDSEGFYYPENYVLDIINDNVYYLETEEEVVRTLNKVFRQTLKTMEEARTFIKTYNDQPEREKDDNYISFNEITIVEL